MPSLVRLCVPLLLPLLAAGCGAPPPAARSVSAAASAGEKAPAPGDTPTEVFLPRKVRRPPPPPRLSWPTGFRLLESGSLGPEVRPAFWWTLDAGDEEPAGAVERVREALARRFGGERIPGAPAVEGDSAAAVFVGPGERASITAHRAEGRTVVRIVLTRSVE